MAIVARTTKWLEPTRLILKAEYTNATYPTRASKILLLTAFGRGAYIIVRFLHFLTLAALHLNRPLGSEIIDLLEVPLRGRLWILSLRSL
jgi:hypothetical protein